MHSNITHVCSPAGQQFKQQWRCLHMCFITHLQEMAHSRLPGAWKVLVQGLDRHRHSLHNVQALSRSSSPNSRSADGAPVPVAEGLTLPPGAAAGSADLPVSLDTAPSSSTLARTLYLLCSWKSIVGPWVVILVQEVTSSQPWPLRELPFSRLVSTDSTCISFETTGCSGSIWTWPR